MFWGARNRNLRSTLWFLAVVLKQLYFIVSSFVIVNVCFSLLCFCCVFFLFLVLFLVLVWVLEGLRWCGARRAHINLAPPFVLFFFLFWLLAQQNDSNPNNEGNTKRHIRQKKTCFHRVWGHFWGGDRQTNNPPKNFWNPSLFLFVYLLLSLFLYIHIYIYSYISCFLSSVSLVFLLLLFLVLFVVPCFLCCFDSTLSQLGQSNKRKQGRKEERRDKKQRRNKRGESKKREINRTKTRENRENYPKQRSILTL